MLDLQYDWYVCFRCDGKGEKWDSTMTNFVGNGGTGMVSCSSCGGRGVRSHPKGSSPGFLDGKRVEVEA